MVRNVIIPVLAVIGFGLGVNTVFLSAQRPPLGQAVAEPAQSPYPEFVAGAGIVEAASENIALAAPVAGIVERVAVTVGSKVKAGDELFVIDTRAARETVAVREAAVGVAQAALEDAKARFDLWDRVEDKRALSAEGYTKRKFAVKIAEQTLKEAQAQLQAARVDLEIRTVRSPIESEILQVNVRPGEFVANQGQDVPILLGDTRRLHLRVDIDENDAWRVRSGSPAKAFVRGNSRLSMNAEFVRFEPYVLPKKSLTGESTERVDTRVLQVLYRVGEDHPALFVGQLVDVFVESGGPET